MQRNYYTIFQGITRIERADAAFANALSLGYIPPALHGIPPPGAAEFSEQAHMSQSQPKKQYLSSLTGLRGLAAMLILANHSAGWLNPNAPLPVSDRLIAVLTSLGMSVFFVLSGFVIHYNYADKFQGALAPAARKFATARFSRLYPLYFCGLILALFTSGYIWKIPTDPGYAKGVLAYLACVQSWFFFTLEGYRLIDILYPLSWAVSTELFLYLLYPLIARAMSRAARPASALAVFFAACVLSLLAMSWFQAQSPWWLLWGANHFPEAANINKNFFHHFHQWAVYLAPYPRIPEFIQGALAAQLLLTLQKSPPSVLDRMTGRLLLYVSLAALAALCVAVTNHDYATLQMLRQNTLFAPALAALMFCLSRYESLPARLMRARPMLFLGEISLALYLVQTWSLRFFASENATPLEGPLLFAWLGRYGLSLAASVAVAWMAYRLIEIPARNALRRRFSRRAA